MSNPLWDFALEKYQLEGVAPLCLELQDGFGIDINIVFYSAWLASQGQRLSPAHLGELVSRVEQWRESVVKPLRALRRQLRSYPAAAAIREDIKVLELQAERQQQDMMYAFYRAARELPREQLSPGDNLQLVAQLASPRDRSWAPIIERLAMCLGL